MVQRTLLYLHVPISSPAWSQQTPFTVVVINLFAVPWPHPLCSLCGLFLENPLPLPTLSLRTKSEDHFLLEIFPNLSWGWAFWTSPNNCLYLSQLYCHGQFFVSWLRTWVFLLLRPKTVPNSLPEGRLQELKPFPSLLSFQTSTLSSGFPILWVPVP